MDELTPLEEKVLARLNSDGRLDGFLAAKGIRNLLPAIGLALGVDMKAGLEALEGHDQLVAGLADGVQFASIGWAITPTIDHESLMAALAILRSTGSLDRAQHTLVSELNREDRLSFSALQIRNVGQKDLELREIARERERLVQKAIDHHRAGAYEASVPILLAQVDGVTYDLVGKSFFASKKVGHQHLVDDTTMLGMPEVLVPLRQVLGENMFSSSATGLLSRHGILHGRELGYDTLANSTKALVLLGAVVGWAISKSAQVVDERAGEYAGSRDLDAKGRRRDRRGFECAQDDLFDVAHSQRVLHQRSGAYSGDLGDLPSLHNADEVASRSTGFGMRVSDDGQAYWAWRGTESEWVFGVAAVAAGDDLFFAGPREPPSPLDAEQAWHDNELDSVPDWDL